MSRLGVDIKELDVMSMLLMWQDTIWVYTRERGPGQEDGRHRDVITLM